MQYERRVEERRLVEDYGLTYTRENDPEQGEDI